jgi:large subunit ribosomal protein L17
MRYKKRGRKLNRTSSHHQAMLRNLVTSLFVHGRVITTPAKAKEARPFAEKLITLAKDGSLHARRRAISLLHDEHVVDSLFSEIGPRYKERPGGYSRILHLAKPRLGYGAPQVLIELIEEEMESKAKAVSAVATVATTAAKAEEEEASE